MNQVLRELGVVRSILSLHRLLVHALLHNAAQRGLLLHLPLQPARMVRIKIISTGPSFCEARTVQQKQGFSGSTVRLSAASPLASHCSPRKG